MPAATIRSADFFDAYDIATGHRVWRFYTVPGDPSKGFEDDTQRKAAETWGGEYWKGGGGGAVWDGMAYDPDLNLVYVGTGNAEPWVQKFRGATGKDNLYSLLHPGRGCEHGQAEVALSGHSQ